ncbi:hypothetical protein [Chitinilyticum piscinae]|uniref:Heparinase II N-terminal domain-containing protein n=1 Tax=Chitinilyticum piscinae TaxID=2866724 RepID=A0A8J7G2N7_9NEIS|nr:hypothetical protein [Chitinilyticum piscinae]MBE9610910.1 hypothetical protein [Chitinilyticum piscinae]
MSTLQESRQYPTPNPAPGATPPGSTPMMPVRPEHGLTLEQNPPTFTWPMQDFTSDYQQVEYILEIRHPDGHVEAFSSPYNWYLPRKLYSPGTYEWRVTGKGLDLKPNLGKDSISGWRRFTISPTAMPLVEQSQLSWFVNDRSWYEQVKQSPHPRLQPEQLIDELRPALTTGERSEMFKYLIKDVRNQAARAVLRDTSGTITADYRLPAMPVLGTETIGGLPPEKYYIIKSQEVPAREHRLIANSTLVWLIYRHSSNPDEQALARLAMQDAKDRVMNLAGWPGLGLDAYAGNTDSGARWTLLAMVRGYDALYPVLSQSEREMILRNARTRFANMEPVLIGKRRYIERTPMDSHNVQAIMAMGGITAVLAGDEINGQAAFDEAVFSRYVPLIYAFGSPWGDSDGGWTNSGGYGTQQPDGSYLHLDALKYAAQIDPYRLMQQRNYMHWHMISNLPGRIPAPFGDGADVEKTFPRRMPAFCTPAIRRRIWRGTRHSCPRPTASDHSPG